MVANLDNLVRAGQLKREPPAQAEIDGLLRSGLARLKDAENAALSLDGRFDLAFDGVGPPKLLEYNADTPTSLLEAAVIQWQWLQDCHPKSDQFNSIHERLIKLWKDLAKYLPKENAPVEIATTAKR